MAQTPKITTNETRFPLLRVRQYANVYCVGVPSGKTRPLYRKPFADSWWRIVAFDEGGPADGADVGPIYRTKAEVYGDLADYARRNGYELA